MVIVPRARVTRSLAIAIAVAICPAAARADDASDDADSACVDTHTLQTPAGLRTNCAPYICTNASCLRACETADDCVTGRVCYQSKCELEEAIAPPESSCSVGRASSNGSGGGVFMVVAIAWFVRSRRRARTIV